MAISINWATKRITVPQADLTLISGTLYELDTNDFRLELKSLEDDAEGMPYVRTHIHNTEVTVAGTTYARTIEIINGYDVEFEDGQYSVRLVGSNNNIWDIENGILVQNQVQVIPTNSAGLISVPSGSGLDAAQDAKLTNINAQLSGIEGGLDHNEMMRVFMAALANKLAGAGSTQITIRDLADSKNRITATVDSDGNRTSVTLDAT